MDILWEITVKPRLAQVKLVETVEVSFCGLVPQSSGSW